MVHFLRSISQSLIRVYVRWERWIIAGLVFLLVTSLLVLLFRFYRQSTVLVPAVGGTYIEGSVGTLQPLNPWFTVTNDVNRDIVSLIFGGLLKYNPQSRMIEEDLATYTVSKDAKTYTVTLKPDLFWHDSTKEAPHPVTADDVVFTYKTIQDPDFPNSLLRQNFRGVTINKIDNRTVAFVLDNPYGFFTSNLTLGLLPHASFGDVPVKLLDQTLDFGFSPVGAGPYKIKSLTETEISTEVTLERFDRTIEPGYHLERIVFRVFPDYQSLLSDLHNLDGIRMVPHTQEGKPAIPNRFSASNYTLPQYTALFFNLDRKIVQDQELRLGLQLGTNKEELANAVGESVIVDTPLLELDESDWRYHFDPEAAAGALFQSAWYFPEKLHLQRLLEQREANQQGVLRLEPVVFLDTGAVLNISGSGGGLSNKNKINGVPLQSNPTSSGGWIAPLPTVSRGTGSIKIGLNLIRLTDEKGRTIDSFYVRRAVDAVQYQLALREQQLVDIFVRSRAGSIPEDQRLTVKDFTVDRGFLRVRKPTDPVGVRTNDAGQSLTITLLTSPTPESYKRVAENVKEQWARLGVNVHIVIPETRADFEEKLLKRDYDVLLFGQSLLDNLDSYPYWHSSGVQRVTGNRNDLRLDAYNLSQYQSFQSDSLLEAIRETTNEAERTEALKKLKETLKKDVPAVFLYSPLYTFSHRDDILGIELGHLSLHSDRFLTLYRWYVKQERVFADGRGWLSFFHWMSSLF